MSILSDCFNNVEVQRQVEYLGLIDNVRARRAGFAYKQTYESFLYKYKALLPSTWPRLKDDAKVGVKELLNHLNFKESLDYSLGR